MLKDQNPGDISGDISGDIGDISEKCRVSPGRHWETFPFRDVPMSSGTGRETFSPWLLEVSLP